MNGSWPLYDELHRRYEAAAEPQRVHRFLAGLPPLLRARGVPHQLIISTRYDLGLERGCVAVDARLRLHRARAAPRTKSW